MLYVYFSHSQKQEYLQMGLIAAFQYFGGYPKEIVVDNMKTAVVERVGTTIRFNDCFLDFLRPFNITPRACSIRAPYEKGKVENSIKYIRQNFWPLRTFKDIIDVQNQMDEWLNNIANIRIHQTTGKRPVDQLKKETLSPLPKHLPDLRESLSPLVHKDFAIRFDSNIYSVPPWAIGKNVTVKAERKTIQIFYKNKLLAKQRFPDIVKSQL
jgi:hypothetical protein